jgi:putative oxidoreductase
MRNSRSRASEMTGDRLERWTPQALSMLRIMTGLLFLEHGTQKLLGFPPSEHSFPALFSLMGVQGVLELIGGFLILIGLFTRPVAFILAGDMAVAYFMAHAPRGFFPTLNGGQLAILFCFVFLYLVVAGGGKWSVDAQIARKWSLA